MMPVASKGCTDDDRQFLRDSSETGASRHAIDQTDSEKRERAGGAAEEKVFQTCFGRSHIGLVERSHHVKGKAQQFEPNENHEQLFTANKQHETDRCQKNNRQVFARMTQRFFRSSQTHREKGKHEANDFEKRREGCDHKHPAEKARLAR